MKELPILKSERFVLKHLSLYSADSMVEFFRLNEKHFAPTSPSSPRKVEDLSFWQERIDKAAQNFEKGLAVRFVVDIEDKIAGTVNFSEIVRGCFHACYLGYQLGEDYCGKGLATEAVGLGVRYMFEEQNLHRIMANYLIENKVSARVLEKLGFEKEGIARDYLHIAGKWQDHVLTALSNPNWKDSR